MYGTVGLSFSQPAALLLLVALAPIILYLARTSLAHLRRGARRWSLGLRLLILALLVSALAGVGVTRADARLSVVYLLDRSASISASAQSRQQAYVGTAVSKLGANDAAGVVLFGTNALVDRPVLSDKTTPDFASAPGTTYTDLAGAIRLGLGIAPAGTACRLVILSDGQENLNSAETAAKLAAANGVPVDVVPLPAATGPEVWVSSLTAPSPVRENERVSLQIGISAGTDTTATLLITVDGRPFSSQSVSLVNGSNSFVQTLPPAVAGFHTYSVQVAPQPGTDTRAENNRYSAFSLVLGKPKLLIVEGHTGEAAALQSAIAGSMDADVVAPAAMPSDLASLAQYSGVVLVNVPASALAAKSMSSLQSAVRDLGKGLVVVGGDESYAAGGYFRTPLEVMLPLNLNLPSKLNIPSVGMVLVIDRSGSMSEGHSVNGVGVTKLELAKEAAYQAVLQLSNKDYVGVVTFDTGADWTVNLQPLGDPSQFEGKIRGINVGGGTDIYAGLSPAVQALVGSNAAGKHIILLTDGQSEGGDYQSLINQMSANNITLTTVAVGSDADTAFLQTLATAGKGRFYDTGQGDSLPAIFAHETHLAERSYIIEHPFSPERTAPSPILDGLGALPGLLGYVGTSPKDGGQIDLVSDAGDPLLAQWQYGLGRVVAWTSDAKGQWAKDWVGWSDFARFWTQVTSWSTGSQAGNLLQPKVAVEGGVAHVTVDAAQPDGSYLSGLSMNTQVVGPTSETATVTLRESAAGEYEGAFPAIEEGAYLLHVQATGQGVGNGGAGQTFGMVVPYSPEFRGITSDNGLLSRLAALTGGRVLSLDNPAATLEHTLPAQSSTTDLWPLLLLLAILLLPFDIAVRRLALTRQDLRKGWRAVRARIGFAPRPVAATQGAVATPQLAALFGAKERRRELLETGLEGTTPASQPLQNGSEARDLPVEGRAGRLGRYTSGREAISQAPALPLTATQVQPGPHPEVPQPHQRPAPQQPEPPQGAPDTESVAARLRRARDQRR